MNHHRNCDGLWDAVADPRVPIEFNKNTGKYQLLVNTKKRLSMVYCFRCGESLIRNKKEDANRKKVCKHLDVLTSELESSVQYRENLSEFWVVGRDSVMVRLFYCPFCGRKLPLGSNKRDFHSRSLKEVSKLNKQFQSISSIEQAIHKFGRPDGDQGPVVDFVYHKGRRRRIGYKRAVFYNNLAKTLVACISEELDGSVDIKFYSKAKKGVN